MSTITIAFDEAGFSEADSARAIAAHFRTRHHEINITGDMFMRDLPNILRAGDQPGHDGVNTYYVAKAARDAGLTVALSGLGGDELFYGYKHYQWLTNPASPLRCLTLLPPMIRKRVLSAAALYGRLSGSEKWSRLLYYRDTLSAAGLYLSLRGFFPPQQVRSLLGITDAELVSIIEEVVAGKGATVENGNTVAASMNHMEFQLYLHDQLLRDTDVYSMAHSIEVRVPYLDDPIVRHALSTPNSMKVQEGVNKPMLVSALDNDMISQVSRASKRGFTFPFQHWMKRHSSPLRDVAFSSDMLDRTEVRKLWAAFDRDRLHWSRAWSMVVLGAHGNRSAQTA